MSVDDILSINLQPFDLIQLYNSLQQQNSNISMNELLDMSPIMLNMFIKSHNKQYDEYIDLQKKLNGFK